MTLSHSRQQFLAYESQTPEEIHCDRRGGTFVTTCVCASFVVLAVLVAVIVGVIVYFITSHHMLSQNSVNSWDETEPFGKSAVSAADLRLPTDVVPSFYRLKLTADLNHSKFSGDVYITIKASKPTKKIILHAKDLIIKDKAKLTEQIYEHVDTLTIKKKREVSNEATTSNAENSMVSTAGDTSNNTTSATSANTTDLVQETVATAPNVTEAQNTTETVAIPTNESSVANETITTTETLETNVTTEATTEPTKPATHTQVSHSSVRDIKIISVTPSSGDRLVVALANALQPGVDYTLELSFEGNISSTLMGFYMSSYVNEKNETRPVAATQFEPTSARAAFPCFDEPQLKARFEISVAHARSLTVLSNMRSASQEDIAERPEYQWTHFERSVNMSTYLVAYFVSDFQSLETSYRSIDNVTKPIRVWARPDFIGKAKYALSITPKLLQYYEEVFGVPYALDKLDLVAVPDFASGAMENWGLVTFRETTLLLDEGAHSPRDKRSVAVDVAHELAHQWFGNLVTMSWWTDLWLNEGFATYIEYVGVDRIEPSWRMLESFSLDKMDLLRGDALKNTWPVSRRVLDPAEISQKFDEISYAKGASLVRMLNHTISHERFYKGLNIYLNEWKFSNAEENDLWAAMSVAAGAGAGGAAPPGGVVRFMNSWTRQAGYPLVSVTREHGKITFTQNLFTSSEHPYPSMAEQIWQIPISYATLDSTPMSTEPRLWLLERSVTVDTNISSETPIYVNVDAIGYYRVLYSARDWQLLRAALPAAGGAAVRAQLIDDAFNLAKTGHLDYSSALNLSTVVRGGEESKLVWDVLLTNLVFLKYTLHATSAHLHFQDYVRLLISPALARLHYGLAAPLDDSAALLAESLLSWECYVETPRCLQWARDQFEEWALHPDNSTIPAHLRGLVYSTMAKHGGRREWEMLWTAYRARAELEPGAAQALLASLPATRDEALLRLLLERSLTSLPQQHAATAWQTDSAAGARAARDFLLANWARVYKHFTDIDPFMFGEVLNGAFGLINTQHDLDFLKQFALQHKEELRPLSQTLQKLVDAAALRVDWAAKYAARVDSWLTNYVDSESSSPTSRDATADSSTNSATNETLPESHGAGAGGDTISNTTVTKPIVPAVTEPTIPAVTGPTISAVTEPTKPVVTEPTVPAVTEPTIPAVTGPTISAVTGHTISALTGPTISAVTEPTISAVTGPTISAVTEPTIPAVTNSTTASNSTRSTIV